MDVDIKNIHSNMYKSKESSNILENIEDIIDKAEEIRDRKDVENPELVRSLDIVKTFLIKRKLICYGGMAINAQVSEDKKFYDFSRELPDYDFFTPTPNRDIEELSRMLKNAGFTNITIRLAVNPGTTKVSVDFNPIADITYMPPWIFRELSKRAFVDKEGIHYADTDFLRLKMYLELSRPLGQVDRWKKVYQRLILLSDSNPIDISHCSLQKAMKIPNNVHESLLQYTIEKELIFLGAEVLDIYKDPSVFRKEVLETSVNPVLVMSADPEVDAKNVKKLLKPLYKEELHILNLKQKGEFLPNLVGVVHKKTILFLAIQQHICHSYNEVVYNKKTLLIGSLDTCMYIFFLLSYLHELNGILPYTFECFAKQLVKISNDTRDKNKTGIFPLISIPCKGYQASIQSLLRHKQKRVAVYKATEKIRKLKKKIRNNTRNNTTKKN